jgi:hypothetical protein
LDTIRHWNALIVNLGGHKQFDACALKYLNLSR